MYSKAKNHLLRLSANIWILENSFKIAHSIDDLENMKFDSFEKICMENSYKSAKIDLATVQKAFKVNDYLIKQKLFLSGYFQDNTESFFSTETTPVTNRKEKHPMKFNLEKHILLTPGNT